MSLYELRNHRLPDYFEWTTVICEACSNASISIVQQVVHAGANALILTCNFKTDSRRLIFYLNQDFELLSHVTTNRGLSASHCAARTGQVDVCEYWLQQGTDDDKQIRTKSSCMYLAASNNHSENTSPKRSQP